MVADRTRSRPEPSTASSSVSRRRYVADVPAAHAAGPHLPVGGREEQAGSGHARDEVVQQRLQRGACLGLGVLGTSVTVRDFNAKQPVGRKSGPAPARARDPRRRGPARRRLRPVGVQRAEHPRPGRARHPRPDPGRGPRARLPPQPLRPRPAQPALAADRGEGGALARRPRGAAARPVPARARRVRGRRRLPPHPLPRRRRGGRDRGLPRPPRDHGRGRVRAGQHPRRRRPGRRRCASSDVPFATFGRSWDGDEELAWVDVDGRGRHPRRHRARRRPGSPADRAPRLAPRLRDRPRPAAGMARRTRPTSASTSDLHAEEPDDFDAGRAAAHRLLDAADPATAIVCSSDTLALGVLRALDDRGLRAGVGRRGHRLRQLPRRRAHHAGPDQPAPAARAGRRRPGRRPRADAGRRPPSVGRPCSCPSSSSATPAAPTRPAHTRTPARSRT